MVILRSRYLPSPRQRAARSSRRPDGLFIPRPQLTSAVCSLLSQEALPLSVHHVVLLRTFPSVSSRPHSKRTDPVLQ
ncbi:hypothetical protein PBY51_006370 [Eleginops maclovinus]|uniref:Uncharacterized protein n=1 Tax=Eleginops maclovinus TaxID=56733 RepID=A0AAN7X109_ELEMC|nr:hypothetical protein PBY51_006370 [Eleginops maclovinus]